MPSLAKRKLYTQAEFASLYGEQGEYMLELPGMASETRTLVPALDSAQSEEKGRERSTDGLPPERTFLKSIQPRTRCVKCGLY